MPVTAGSPFRGSCLLGDRTLQWVVSTRADGDLRPDLGDETSAARGRRRLVDLPWTLLDQQHGTGLVEVNHPGARHLATGDILATSHPQAVVGIWAGDCVPVLLASAHGTLVMAHVGWRGLVRGAVAAAVERVRSAGAGPVSGWIGPHVGPCCYEFGPFDLEVVAQALDVEIAAISAPLRSERQGVDPSARCLDMGAAVIGELRRRGVAEVHGVPCDPVPCTGCDGRWFSWRRRAETERHAMAAWWE